MVSAAYIKPLVFRATMLVLLCALAREVRGQRRSTMRAEPVVTIHSASTLVTVPAIVRLRSGELMNDLSADNFELLDNGTPQHLSLEDTRNEPIALVVLMQTGGAASGALSCYRYLPAIVDSIVGPSTHELMLVTFDSHVEQIWHFPPRSDGVTYALTHQQPGDDGVALLDAVDSAVSLLQNERGSYRRIILLLSQSTDNVSRTPAQQIVRHLGEGSTTVYSATFPASIAKPMWPSRGGSAHRIAPSVQSSTTKPADDSRGNGGGPLGLAVKALRKNSAGELASLSGGQQVKFHNVSSFQQELLPLADEIQHSYSLTFQPDFHEPGFHLLTVRMIGLSSRATVAARISYWFDSSADSR